MIPGDVIRHANWLVENSSSSAKEHAKKATNFLDYANAIKDIVTQEDLLRAAPFDTIQFGLAFRKLRDTYEDEVRRDPMCIYLPAHEVALEFHKSTAFIRYFRGGNRISKTESAAADNYWVVTGQHPHRKTPLLPCSVFIIGVNFSKYGQSVFEKKYLYGEEANPLSPVFPEDGKWFNRYDNKKHILYLSCKECAETGKNGSCKHLKSTVTLFSDREGPTVLAGGQYAQGQFDEHIDQEFFTEAAQRLLTVPLANLAVTHTPLEGKGAWEHQRLTRRFEKGGKENMIPNTDRKFVSLHTIDQFSAGLSNPNELKALMESYSPAEVEARVWGRPAAFSATGVFDSWEMSNMYDEVESPTIGTLECAKENDKRKGKDQASLLEEADEDLALEFTNDDKGDLRVWEKPKPFAQYIIGADVAQGLTTGDYSCAQVLKLTRRGVDLEFEQVAMHHGHINSIVYGEELMKLAIWYNSAILVPERRGPGDATLQRLKALGYWGLFRDASDPAQATMSADALFGLDTNVKTKGIIISMLQNTVKDKRTGRRSIILRDFDTLEQLGHFGQEKTESGLSFRFRGEGGMHDDTVMALSLGIYAARVYPDMYDIELEVKSRKVKNHNLSAHEQSVWDRRDEQIKRRNRSALDE